MPKIVAVARAHMGLQLGLTGLSVREALNSAEAEQIVAECLDGDIDVLIIEETFKAGFTEWFANRLAHHRGKPLVVTCPSFEEEESNVDAYLSAVLKPAIGYEIRLE